nr:CoA transferase [Gemmatimonadota bacterium]
AIGILAALAERERSGRGQRVQVSLLDSAIAGLVNAAQAALVTNREPGRWGNAHAAIVPYQLFHASDRPLVVAVGTDEQWRRFCATLGLDALAEDPRFASNPERVANRDFLLPHLHERLGERSAAEWLKALDDAGVPCALVKSVQEALHDPAFISGGGLWEMEGRTFGRTRSVASPIRLSRTPASLRRAPPSLGEHTPPDPEPR